MIGKRATLDGTDLPLGFHYTLGTPQKRFTVIQTDQEIKIQWSNGDHIVEGDIEIPWDCPACCRDEWWWFHGKFNQATNPTYTFTGYWDDEFEVCFLHFDPPQPKGGVFDLSGSFRVISVTSWGGGD